MTKKDFKIVFIYKSVYWDDTAWYWIYLINYSNEEYEIHYETDGFITVDDEVHKLNWSEHSLEKLNGNSRILVEENDLWSLDMNWFIHLTLKWKSSFKIDFDIWKWSPKWEEVILDWFENKWIIMQYKLKLID